MDGQMSEEIRIGIMVRLELSKFEWYRKSTGLCGYSFSSTLLDEAGGIRKLLEEWEPRNPSLTSGG